MKFRQTKNSSDNCLIDFSDLGIDNLEKDKLSVYREHILTGLQNYYIYQENSTFKWPVWVTGLQKSHNEIKQVVPPVLMNSTLRQWSIFTNLLSRDELLIDPSGMLTTSSGSWAIEFWVDLDGRTLRFDGSSGSLEISRDHMSSIIHINWNTPDFRLDSYIFGARTTVDEAVIDINCSLDDKFRNSSFIIAIRPYNNTKLGGIQSAEYNKNDKAFTINGKKCIILELNPSFVLTGNADDGDINPAEKDDSFKSACREYMSTIAAVYNLKKGDNSFNFRISLNGSESLNPGNYEFKSIREDYAEFAKIRISQGVDLKISDKQLDKWFNISKIALLNSSDSSLFIDNRIRDPEKLFYVIFGYNRMGYFDESMHLVDKAINCLNTVNKEISFHEIINICYVINSFVDYFLHTRDLDYMQLIYNKKLKELGAGILGFSSKLKNLESLRTNSLKNSMTKTPEAYDLILISYTLNSFSYLARCLGIFGDEKKYIKEFEKFQKIIAEYIGNYSNRIITGDLFYYDLAAGFPFILDQHNDENIQEMINAVVTHFNGVKLVNRSLGIDTKVSLILANNLVYLKDPRVFEIIEIMKKIGCNTYMLPEFADPANFMGCYGDGFSTASSSLMFALVRNMIFIDFRERLDIFPVPRDEWFKPGREIIISNAPSRFGKINFRVKSTTNEIQFSFEDLPKYIPPDIMITLPFGAKLIDGEDFILKKSYDNSFIINGWPSLVRFIRRKS